jgi:hypothetical protein
VSVWVWGSACGNNPLWHCPPNLNPQRYLDLPAPIYRAQRTGRTPLDILLRHNIVCACTYFPYAVYMHAGATWIARTRRSPSTCKAPSLQPCSQLVVAIVQPFPACPQRSLSSLIRMRFIDKSESFTTRVTPEGMRACVFS